MKKDVFQQLRLLSAHENKKFVRFLNSELLSRPGIPGPGAMSAGPSDTVSQQIEQLVFHRKKFQAAGFYF
jgi:hypothetical protein